MPIRKKIIVSGVVQGVGFRPFVYKLAGKHGLSGWVLNSAAGVVIEAEGAPRSVERFIKSLSTENPPQSRVNSVQISSARPRGGKIFEIRKSARGAINSALIPADLALCADCAKEIVSPSDRRYGYPFTNCTNCGPRFTIIKSLPYDRRLTTMSEFKMCPACRAEFSNPLDRRFHAQPNACPECGPAVSLQSGKTRLCGAAALDSAARALKSGKIAAIKSLGGYHLACDALNAAAVRRLRARKNRPHKPFAVMFDSVAEARKFCKISRPEAAAIAGVRAPIVMLEKKNPGLFSEAAPALKYLGVMVAYTPLHKALFARLRGAGFSNPLVMTSGNMRDEPICIDRAQAESKLAATADIFLHHDRDIHNRCDDSLAFVSGGALIPLRRARGFVPEPVPLGRGGAPVMGMGAELKNTFCLTRGKEAFLSQHIGDMDERANEEFYLDALAKMKKLFGVRPEIFAHDLHPDYAATRLAARLPGCKLAVQHHFAHIAGVMAEHDIKEPVIGLAFDGTGYGLDGKIWGCEFLVVDGVKWRRAASLRETALPGGDAAAFETWRMGLSWLKTVFGPEWRERGKRFFSGVPAERLRLVERLIDSGVNSPKTTSLGRLFDAVGFLAGVRREVSYEAQGAMEFESLLSGKRGAAWRFDIYEDGGLLVCDPAPVIQAVACGRFGPAEIAARFHASVAAMAAEAAQKISAATGIKTAALSGGVFQNRAVLERTEFALRRKGFAVYSNRLVPANDGGISLGQAWAALNSGL